MPEVSEIDKKIEQATGEEQSVAAETQQQQKAEPDLNTRLAAELEKDDEGATPAGEQQQQPAAQEKTYAGTFKTTDELEKSLIELHKSLNIPQTSLEKRLIEAAKKDGKWDDVESYYKELQAEHTKRKQEAAANPPASTQSPENSDKDLNKLTDKDKEVVKSYFEEWKPKLFKEHPVTERFAKRGIAMPTNQAELDELERVDPFLWKMFVDANDEINEVLSVDIKEVFDSIQGAPGAWEKARSDGKTSIEKINSDFKLGLTEDQIKKYMEDAEKWQEGFTDKNGVKHPTEKAFEKYFKLNVLIDLLPQAIQNAENAGKTKHAEDLKNMKAKVVETASTVNQSKTAGRTGEPVKNLADREFVSKLNLDQVNKELAAELDRD